MQISVYSPPTSTLSTQLNSATHPIYSPPPITSLKFDSSLGDLFKSKGVGRSLGASVESLILVESTAQSLSLFVRIRYKKSSLEVTNYLTSYNQ